MGNASRFLLRVRIEMFHYRFEQSLVLIERLSRRGFRIAMRLDQLIKT